MHTTLGGCSRRLLPGRLGVLAAVALVATVLGQRPCAAQLPERVRPAASTADYLSALDRRWGQAYVHGDSAFIASLLATDYVGWYDDQAANRASALAEVRAGAPLLLEDIVDQAIVRVFGTMAVIQARERAKVPDAKGGHWETRHITDVFIQRSGRWFVIASHDSRIPNP